VFDLIKSKRVELLGAYLQVPQKTVYNSSAT